jgi:hypothetical protein
LHSIILPALNGELDRQFYLPAVRCQFHQLFSTSSGTAFCRLSILAGSINSCHLAKSSFGMYKTPPLAAEPFFPNPYRCGRGLGDQLIGNFLSGFFIIF